MGVCKIKWQLENNKHLPYLPATQTTRNSICQPSSPSTRTMYQPASGKKIPNPGQCQDSGQLLPFPPFLNHLVRAARRRKCIRLGFEHKAHAQDIAHGFFEGSIALEVRVGIDICMDFQFYVVFIEQVAKRIGHFYRTSHFQDHAFAQGHFAHHFIIGNKHKAAPFFPQEDDNGGKMHLVADHLGVGSDAHLEPIAFGLFTPDGFFYCIQQRLRDALAIESSPFHVVIKI